MKQVRYYLPIGLLALAFSLALLAGFGLSQLGSVSSAFISQVFPTSYEVGLQSVLLHQLRSGLLTLLLFGMMILACAALTLRACTLIALNRRSLFAQRMARQATRAMVVAAPQQLPTTVDLLPLHNAA